MDTRYRILIVEDENLYAQALEFFLERHGFDVVVAMNGLQAFAELRRQDVALILLDVNMPGLDGYDVCAALKADPVFGSIPVIFLTSEDDHDSVGEGLRVGAVDYLSKGAPKERLLESFQAQFATP